MPHLALPDPAYRTSFLAAMGEFAAEGRTGDDSGIGQDLLLEEPGWRSEAGFAEYVAALRAETDRPRRPGLVTATTWWWVEGTDYLGRVQLRHELTPRLREVGGHVGYDVRRSARRRGHATAMLAAVLPLARERGIVEALVTCDTDNHASRAVIEANGGVLEDRRGAKLRFRVPTG
ncbi:Predicted acetyltransferase [Nocardioides scoriae]|uniref:Predicted acetyltransferase n=1 Tax=Nocardioides scoriae TaxID=642780 RepID=A0A1H1LYR3_9ACTN|nr:GNAT family N-acetyltransferase [Nocardioides scoriae]SDR79758.1 Predicted acetyltransferase [Nocardioides scoriae]